MGVCRYKARFRESETEQNSIDTAISFYFQQLDGNLAAETRKQYLGIARNILNAAPKHPRREEYERKLKRYGGLS